MLTRSRLIARTLAYHWRSNLAVMLGVTVGAAVLTGSLLVGDSLRGSLREKAEMQLGGVESAHIGTKLIRDMIADELPGHVAPIFMVRGSAQFQDGDYRNRVGNVTVYGVNTRFLRSGEGKNSINWDGEQRVAMLSNALASRLGVHEGDTIEVGIEQFSNVPRSSILGRRDEQNVTKTLRLKVSIVLGVTDPPTGFNLIPTPAEPLNIFVPLRVIQDAVGQPGRVNALFAWKATTTELNAALRQKLTLEDWGIRATIAQKRKEYISVESAQLILDNAAVAAVENAAKKLGLRFEPTSVYLANWIAHGDEKIPYSIVAGLNAEAAAPLGPFLPPGSPPLADDEILLTAWKDSPIKNPKPGERITLTYFNPELESGAREETHSFRLRAVVPMEGAVADPDLTPPFPGVTDKATIGDWDPPFPYDNKRIRPRDEAYWDRYRTTPKAFITLHAAQKLFASRFGSITSIRIAPATNETLEATLERLRPTILAELDPTTGGLHFDDLRERFRLASQGGTDFGMLFLGFSFFLIAASLMLVGLLFRLSLDRRAKEIGLLLATGFSVKQVRRLLLAEGIALAALGAALGLYGGWKFNERMIKLLVALWPDPEVGFFLDPHATVLSFLLGFLATMAMAAFAVFLSCRGLVRIAPPALLRGETSITNETSPRTSRKHLNLIGIVLAIVVGIASLVAGGYQSNPDFRAMSFFSGGGLLLIAALLAMWTWMKRTRHTLVNGRGPVALARLGIRNAARNPLRSLLTAALIASAAFLLVAVESFRRQPDPDFLNVHGGSGGFNLIAESAVPFFQRFDTGKGRGELEDRLQRAFGGSDQNPKFRQACSELDAISPDTDGVPNVFPLRLRGGDDASCLNLFQAGRPRLLGVPDDLIRRGGFEFGDTEAATPEEKTNPWLLLTKPTADGSIPIFVEQNTAMWMLKTGVGGEVTQTDDDGRDVKFRIVGTLIDSPFQSELLMSDDAFRKAFPRQEGFRVFLIRTPPGRELAIARVLDLGLQNYGFEAQSARDKVAAYQSVIGAYLSTFQVLGGLGLLLGVLGLAVVILRGIWERIGELALFRALGYRKITLQGMVLAENAVILVYGLFAGVIAAVLSVAPHAANGAAIPWLRLAVLLGIVLLVGFLAAAAATASILRVPLIPALRRE